MWFAGHLLCMHMNFPAVQYLQVFIARRGLQSLQHLSGTLSALRSKNTMLHVDMFLYRDLGMGRRRHEYLVLFGHELMIS